MHNKRTDSPSRGLTITDSWGLGSITKYHWLDKSLVFWSAKLSEKSTTMEVPTRWNDLIQPAFTKHLRHGTTGVHNYSEYEFLAEKFSLIMRDLILNLIACRAYCASSISSISMSLHFFGIPVAGSVYRSLIKVSSVIRWLGSITLPPSQQGSTLSILFICFSMPGHTSILSFPDFGNTPSLLVFRVRKELLILLERSATSLW